MTRRSGWDVAFGRVRDDDVSSSFLVAVVVGWVAAVAAIIALMRPYEQSAVFLWALLLSLVSATSSAIRTLVVRWRRARRDQR